MIADNVVLLQEKYAIVYKAKASSQMTKRRDKSLVIN